MLAPILPSPIIPSCILLFFLCAYLLQFKRRVPLSKVDRSYRRREFVQIVFTEQLHLEPPRWLNDCRINPCYIGNL